MPLHHNAGHQPSILSRGLPHLANDPAEMCHEPAGEMRWSGRHHEVDPLHRLRPELSPGYTGLRKSRDEATDQGDPHAALRRRAFPHTARFDVRAALQPFQAGDPFPLFRTQVRSLIWDFYADLKSRINTLSGCPGVIATTMVSHANVARSANSVRTLCTGKPCGGTPVLCLRIAAASVAPWPRVPVGAGIP
jgi:hypothetical protein